VRTGAPDHGNANQDSRGPLAGRRGRGTFSLSRTWQHASRAFRKRAELIRRLGGQCRVCGSTDRLELHHPHGRDWTPRRHNRWTRINHYWRDWEQGNLELLCQSCNGRDGARRSNGS